jgi:hypothetical protein
VQVQATVKYPSTRTTTVKWRTTSHPQRTLFAASMMSPWYSRASQWSPALPRPPSDSRNPPGIVGQPDWARASRTTLGVMMTSAGLRAGNQMARANFAGDVGKAGVRIKG